MIPFSSQGQSFAMRLFNFHGLAIRLKLAHKYGT